jgi:hypothetical protein
LHDMLDVFPSCHYHLSNKTPNMDDVVWRNATSASNLDSH